MALDRNCKDTPYLLGRIAAIIGQSVKLTAHQMEQAQETPYVIFPAIIARYHEAGEPEMPQEFSAIMDMLPSDFTFPQRLALPEQGQFIIGHDHQASEIYRQRNRRNVAKAVKLKRTELGLTQTQLAERAGTTQMTVGKIEGGDSNVSLDLLSSVMAVLGLKMEIE